LARECGAWQSSDCSGQNWHLNAAVAASAMPVLQARLLQLEYRQWGILK
jgi:hypothetical protein